MRLAFCLVLENGRIRRLPCASNRKESHRKCRHERALYRFLWDEAETQGMGGMKKGNEVSNL